MAVAICVTYFRVTTCLENLEMSGNLTAVREMLGILLKVGEMSGKKSYLVRVKLPKTVYCKLLICIDTGIGYPVYRIQVYWHSCQFSLASCS